MKIAVLGTGGVGRTIATKLVSLGHEVKLGSRTADNENAAEWVASAGSGASQGTFEDAASSSEVVFNCTSGGASLDALRSAGAVNLEGKVLVDVANALAFEDGKLAGLLIDTRDSLAEQIQREFPDARVVKTLNMMNSDVMVDPSLVPGGHEVFVAGNDDAAKDDVRSLLESFGWDPVHIVDLGDLSGARAMELYVVFWLRLFGTLGTSRFNIAVQRQ
jgi:hypothetical protein